jgi:general secretion pathway protein J
MKPAPARRGRPRGFTLIEILSALLILSLLALMSYRGLGAVLDAREHTRYETEKWRRVSAFFARFERDVQLAAPRPVRATSSSSSNAATSSGIAPAWRGEASAT